MHLHLDVVGGVAGDMFAATMLDAWPELENELKCALERAGFGRLVSVARKDFDDGVLVGSQVSVDPATEEAHHHRSWRDIREMLSAADLSDGVRRRALAIFTLLAEAESEVHGKPIEDVAFHEVGAWDSIADVVMAAWLIDHAGDASWSCSPVPAGRGTVNTVHGRLPVPTPATAWLIRGMPVFTDDVRGDRITPTGAAILNHLAPNFAANLTGVSFVKTGVGFGTSRFKGISNMLRVSVYETTDSNDSQTTGIVQQTIAQIEFEIDDQSPEDLAVAVENLRALDGVHDVIQRPAFGKKGRVMSQIQILSALNSKDQVAAECFRQTTTLGVRIQTVQRQILRRELGTQYDPSDSGSNTDNATMVRYKSAQRPDGEITVKAEMDDIASSKSGHADRQALRRRIEDAAKEKHSTAHRKSDLSGNADENKP